MSVQEPAWIIIIIIEYLSLKKYKIDSKSIVPKPIGSLLSLLPIQTTILNKK